MHIVTRAYFQARRELQPDTAIEALHKAMIFNMVRWIKLRAYSRTDWPSEFGEYPKEMEKEIK